MGPLALEPTTVPSGTKLSVTSSGCGQAFPEATNGVSRLSSCSTSRRARGAGAEGREARSRLDLRNQTMGFSVPGSRDQLEEPRAYVRDQTSFREPGSRGARGGRGRPMALRPRLSAGLPFRGRGKNRGGTEGRTLEAHRITPSLRFQGETHSGIHAGQTASSPGELRVFGTDGGAPAG